MIVRQIIPKKIIDKMNNAKVGDKIKYGIGYLVVKNFNSVNDKCDNKCICYGNEDFCKQVNCMKKDTKTGIYFEYIGK